MEKNRSKFKNKKFSIEENYFFLILTFFLFIIDWTIFSDLF